MINSSGVDIIEDSILTVLRDSADPLDVARIRKAVHDRYAIPLARQTVDRVLNRLRLTGVTGYVDDPGYPRRWLAAPAQFTADLEH